MTGLTGFTGIDEQRSNNGGAPPDTSLAVGRNYVVEVVNIEGGVYNKNGTLVRNFGLDSFFQTGSDFITDPRVIYDADSERWFITLQDVDTSAILVAISGSENPTGTWTFYKFPFPGCPDQPSLGVSSDKFVVSVNTYSNKPYQGVQYTVVDKNDLIRGVENPRSKTSLPDSDKTLLSLHPAENVPSNSTNTIYMIAAHIGGSQTVKLVKLNDTFSNIQVTSQTIKIKPIDVPQNAKQPGPEPSIPTGDGRITDATWSNDNLWFTLTDPCTPVGDDTVRSCILLTEYNTANGTVSVDFDIFVKGSYLSYPAIGADASGNLGVAYELSSDKNFTSLLLSGHSKDEPDDSLGQPVVAHNGIFHNND